MNYFEGLGGKLPLLLGGGGGGGGGGGVSPLHPPVDETLLLYSSIISDSRTVPGRNDTFNFGFFVL